MLNYKWVVFLTWILLLHVTAAGGQTLAEKVQEHTFSNGLRLLLVERHDSPTVAAYITIGVGSVNETNETRGVAHLLEHMLFKGTKTLGTTNYRQEAPLLAEIELVGSELDALVSRKDADPQDIAAVRGKLQELQKRHQQYVVKDEVSRIYAEKGGVGYNAFTGKDLTTYLISLPSNKLELWAAIESDRMKNAVLREFFTERDVIQEERRRSYESSPSGLLYENLLATAFSMHPYRNPTIGWHSDIENLSLAETRDFLHKYYAPVNTVIALVGDVAFNQAVALVEKYFGDIQPGIPVPPVVAVEPPQRGEKRVQVDFEAEPSLSIAFHKPTLPDRVDYVFDLINMVLGQGRTSRLYQSLVVEKQLVAAITTSGAPGSRYPNLFVISATPRYPHTVAEVEQAIYDELEKLANEPVAEEELVRSRNRLATDRLRSLKGNGGLAHMLTYYQSVTGDWRYLVDYDEQVAGISAEEIMAVAKTYFTQENRTLATLNKIGGGL